MEIDRIGHTRMRFVDDEGGFTTPAIALAILLACSLIFISARGAIIGSRSGQIQYVADAGALAADNIVAEFVTIGQIVDAVLLSMSLLGLSVYAVSAVAAFIPGAQNAAAKIAQAGSKILQARDKFAETATKGLNTAQKALPAICAVRAFEVINANASASGIPYAGAAITSPIMGAEVSLADDSEVEEAAEEIESKHGDIQEKSVQAQDAQNRENDAKHRAWMADCGNAGMSMFERAGHLSDISAANNPHYSSADAWNFSIPLERAEAYYAARYYAEAGSGASGSPDTIAESVARKQFYAYARDEVSQGYVETTDTGAQIPHLVQLARNTEQIRSTSLYTDAIYPISSSNGTRTIHAYAGCPGYSSGSPSGYGSVSEVDSGSVHICEHCRFSATTLGRVPSASTSIDNGFEYYYLAVVEASKDYAQAVEDGEDAKRHLKESRESIGNSLHEALKALAAKRYDPQPPGRYGCICVVIAPNTQLKDTPFIDGSASIPARVAISGATLAADPADDEGNIISDIAQGLVPSENLGSGLLKLVFGAWGSMLKAYTDGTEGIKQGLDKLLGAIPIVGNTLSEQATQYFKNALSDAGLEPADLKSYKPVIVNTSRIIERDGGKAAQIIGHMKQAAAMYSAVSIGDIGALIEDIEAVPEIQELLDEHGLTIAEIPLSDLGVGNGSKKLYLPVPMDISSRLEELRSLLLSTAAE